MLSETDVEELDSCNLGDLVCLLFRTTRTTSEADVHSMISIERVVGPILGMPAPLAWLVNRAEEADVDTYN